MGKRFSLSHTAIAVSHYAKHQFDKPGGQRGEGAAASTIFTRIDREHLLASL